MAVFYSQSFGGEKLLMPLAGIFAAILISAAGEAAPLLPPPPDLSGYPVVVKETLVASYENIGASGLAAVGTISVKSDQAVQKVESSVAGTWLDLKTNVGSAGEELWIQTVAIVKNLGNFFLNVWISITTSLNDLYANLLSGIGFLIDRLEILSQAPVSTVRNLAFQTEVQTVLVAESLQANAQQIAALGNLSFDKINLGLETIKAKLVLWWSNVVQAWRSFIGLDSQAVPVSPAADTGFTPTDRADLNQIKQNVGTILELINQEPVSRGPSQGMVVLPTTGTAASDQQLKSQVANMFSDRVSVELDQTRKSGVITPVFKDGTGSNYIFLLAPVNQ